jgi:hypothetical protein
MTDEPAKIDNHFENMQVVVGQGFRDGAFVVRGGTAVFGAGSGLKPLVVKEV